MLSSQIFCQFLKNLSLKSVQKRNFVLSKVILNSKNGNTSSDLIIKTDNIENSSISKEKINESNKIIDLSLAIKNLEEFEDEKQIVYDITDEINKNNNHESEFKYLYQNKDTKSKIFNDPFLVKHGEKYVFDLDQIVYALKKEKVVDIAVIKIPEKLKIEKYFVIGSANSKKHLLVVFEYIKKLYKIKKFPSDPPAHYEGKESSDWKIIDMENIMLHLFLKNTREYYDIEQLWTVGAQYDDKCRVKKTKLEELIEENSNYLDKIEAQ